MKNTKRKYTVRGSTVVGVRTVLLNGAVVGKGRPAKEGKGQRMVVYLPKGETYDVAKHGLGVKFHSDKHPAIRRLKVSNVVVDLAPTVQTVTETVESVPAVETVEVSAEVAPSEPALVSQGAEFVTVS